MIHRETLYRAVYITDKFLSISSVKKHDYQLVGTAALMIASKLEEVFPKSVEEFCRCTNNGYSSEEIKAKEEEMLIKMKWFIFPDTMNFHLMQLMMKWDEYCRFVTEQGMYHAFTEANFMRPKSKDYELFRQAI